MSVMTPFVGKAADMLVDQGWDLTNVRKLMQVGLSSVHWPAGRCCCRLTRGCAPQGISFGVPALCMIGCAVLTPSGPTTHFVTGSLVALMSVAFAAASWARAGLYCCPQVGLSVCRWRVQSAGWWC